MTGVRFSYNTFNPSLDIIIDLGYVVRCVKTADDRLAFGEWQATKDECVITAFSPPELLGLVMIYETYGMQWSSQQYQSNYEEYMPEPAGSTSWWKRWRSRR